MQRQIAPAGTLPQLQPTIIVAEAPQVQGPPLHLFVGAASFTPSPTFIKAFPVLERLIEFNQRNQAAPAQYVYNLAPDRVAAVTNDPAVHQELVDYLARSGELGLPDESKLSLEALELLIVLVAELQCEPGFCPQITQLTRLYFARLPLGTLHERMYYLLRVDATMTTQYLRKVVDLLYEQDAFTMEVIKYIRDLIELEPQFAYCLMPHAYPYTRAERLDRLAPHLFLLDPLKITSPIVPDYMRAQVAALNPSDIVRLSLEGEFTVPPRPPIPEQPAHLLKPPQRVPANTPEEREKQEAEEAQRVEERTAYYAATRELSHWQRKYGIKVFKVPPPPSFNISGQVVIAERLINIFPQVLTMNQQLEQLILQQFPNRDAGYVLGGGLFSIILNDWLYDRFADKTDVDLFIYGPTTEARRQILEILLGWLTINLPSRDYFYFVNRSVITLSQPTKRGAFALQVINTDCLNPLEVLMNFDTSNIQVGYDLYRGLCCTPLFALYYRRREAVLVRYNIRAARLIKTIYRGFVIKLIMPYSTITKPKGDFYSNLILKKGVAAVFKREVISYRARDVEVPNADAHRSDRLGSAHLLGDPGYYMVTDVYGENPSKRVIKVIEKDNQALRLNRKDLGLVCLLEDVKIDGRFRNGFDYYIERGPTLSAIPWHSMHSIYRFMLWGCQIQRVGVVAFNVVGSNRIETIDAELPDPPFEKRSADKLEIAVTLTGFFHFSGNYPRDLHLPFILDREPVTTSNLATTIMEHSPYEHAAHEVELLFPGVQHKIQRLSDTIESYRGLPNMKKHIKKRRAERRVLRNQIAEPLRRAVEAGAARRPLFRYEGPARMSHTIILDEADWTLLDEELYKGEFNCLCQVSRPEAPNRDEEDEHGVGANDGRLRILRAFRVLH
jgi:hypothetical protein